MTDGPVLTSYPHDRLSRLADAMTETLKLTPGTDDIRAVVMLNDRETGCVHPHNYPEREGQRNAMLFIDIVQHLTETGRALGMRVEVLVNGKNMGAAPDPDERT
jgi:hypothetical protein